MARVGPPFRDRARTLLGVGHGSRRPLLNVGIIIQQLPQFCPAYLVARLFELFREACAYFESGSIAYPGAGPGNTAFPRKLHFEREGSNYKYCSIGASPTVTKTRAPS